ncbi:MAG TPA: hypothetical protein VE997_04615, partial [Candidatus Limnocylindria bacterium]|nr:hypothetical protein [Candidatus Limnocylindria bacterium]
MESRRCCCRGCRCTGFAVVCAFGAVTGFTGFAAFVRPGAASFRAGEATFAAWPGLTAAGVDVQLAPRAAALCSFTSGLAATRVAFFTRPGAWADVPRRTADAAGAAGAAAAGATRCGSGSGVA